MWTEYTHSIFPIGMHFTRIVMFYEKIDHAFADHIQIKSNRNQMLASGETTIGKAGSHKKDPRKETNILKRLDSSLV